MSQYLQIAETGVDRREETVTTQQPGYASTQQVTQDVAAERRLSLMQVNRIVYTILGVLEILLGLRYVLKLIGANAQNGFAAFVYALTALFVVPFTGVVATWSSEGMILEVTTLMAMTVYLLCFWAVLRIIPIVLDRLSARTVTRSTLEQTGGGGLLRLQRATPWLRRVVDTAQPVSADTGTADVPGRPV